MVRVLGKFLYTSTDVSFSNNIFSFSYCCEFIFMYTITILIYAVLLNPAVFFSVYENITKHSSSRAIFL